MDCIVVLQQTKKPIQKILVKTKGIFHGKTEYCTTKLTCPNLPNCRTNSGPLFFLALRFLLSWLRIQLRTTDFLWI